MLRLEGVSKSFGGVQAVDDVSAVVAQGDILGLIGPNGAGKTTLFNIIAGMLTPDVGTVMVDGHAVTRRGPAEMCRLGVARTFQIPRPFPSLSVLDNAMVGALARQKYVRLAERQATDCLERVGLQGRAQDRAGVLPLGQLKRLELARSLATAPSLLLIDEICGGLSPSETGEMVEVVRRIHAEGTTVVIVEHNLPVILALATNTIVLNFGKKIAEGPPAVVAQHPEVVKSYLGDG